MMIPPHSAVADNAFLLIPWCTTSLFFHVKHGVTQNGTELRHPDASTLALFVKHAPEVGQTMHCMRPFPAPLALHPLLQNYAQWGDTSPICAPKNAYHYDKHLISEPISNSLQPPLRKTCYHKIAIKMIK